MSPVEFLKRPCVIYWTVSKFSFAVFKDISVMNVIRVFFFSRVLITLIWERALNSFKYVTFGVTLSCVIKEW